MDIQEAQKKVDERIKNSGGYWQPLSILARITEELGELSGAINMKYGDKKSKPEIEEENLSEKVVNVQYALFAIANKCEVDIDGEFTKKMKEVGHANKLSGGVDNKQ